MRGVVGHIDADPGTEQHAAQLVFIQNVQRDAADGRYAAGYKDGRAMGFDEAVEKGRYALDMLRLDDKET